MFASRWLLHVILAMFGDPADAPPDREAAALHETALFPRERETVSLSTRDDGMEIPAVREAYVVTDADEIPALREESPSAPATREN